MAFNSSLAEALMTIGQTLPGTLRQRQLDEQAAKTALDQKALNDISLQLKKQELEKANQEAAIAKQNQALSDQGNTQYGLYKEAQRINPAIADLKTGSELSSTPTPYRMDYLENQQPAKSNLELANKFDLPRLSEYNKGLDRVMTQMNTEEQRRQAESTKTADRELKDSINQMKLENMQKLNEDRLANTRTLAGINNQARADIAEKNIMSKSNGLNSDEKSQHAQDVIDRVNNLETSPGFSGSVGFKGASSLFGLKKEPIAGTNEAGFNAEYNALKSLLTLDNIGKLKGVLSDTDMKVLSQAASSLDLNMPEKDFRNELNRVKSVMSKVPKVQKIGVKNEQSIDEDSHPSKPDSFGYTIGQKRFSKKFNKEFTYVGNNTWE